MTCGGSVVITGPLTDDEIYVITFQVRAVTNKINKTTKRTAEKSNKRVQILS